MIKMRRLTTHPVVAVYTCWRIPPCLKDHRKYNQTSEEVRTHLWQNSRLTGNASRYSLDVSADQDKPEKLLKSAHAVPNTELIVAPQSQHGITNTSGIATEFHTVQPPTRDPIHSHWEQATDQGAESDAARYVHNANLNSYGSPMPCASSSQWRDYPVATNTQSHFNPVYGQDGSMEMPENALSMSQAVGPSPMNITFQPNFSDFVQETWNDAQEPNQEDPEPD